MVAKHAKIDMVGILDAGFQQNPLVQKFWKFYKWTAIIEISEENKKKIV